MWVLTIEMPGAAATAAAAADNVSDREAAMANAAVAIGQLIAKEDEIWNKIFHDDSETTTPAVDQSSKCCISNINHMLLTCLNIIGMMYM